MKVIKFSFFVLFLLSSSLSFAQIKVETSGKISVGNVHSLDNGRLKIGNDGPSQGLSFFDSSTGGTDFRIYRLGNAAYFTRGGNHSYGLRINDLGQVAIGSNQIGSYTDFAGLFNVYAQSTVAIGSRTYHQGDYGDAQKSIVYRPLTIGYGVWYNNNETFYVYGNGEVHSSVGYITSDASLKNNVELISNPLDKVLQLRGVTYNLNFPEELYSENKEKNKELSIEQAYEAVKVNAPQITWETFNQIQTEKSRKQMGVIAQEVEKVIPEVVRTRVDGLKEVAYTEIVGLLIEAIKELKIEVDELKENKVADAQLRSSTNETGMTDMSNPAIAQCKLYQNVPNPFTGQTEIKYTVAGGVKNAFICIFDMQGKMLKKMDAVAGENTLTIRRSELHAGMYLYSLIADGKEVDTKRMILTK
ncbi:hypothetical protein FACS189437_09680 [Bacteroidia bacterium]|nr:hypothetical protein FACS189437_09680 [Bacteroidia bacterium]